MKHNFMNKENGKIASVLVMYLDDDGNMQTDCYDKVEDLMEDYAAYKPAEPEPLIKDEKIRKVFREWAALLGAERFRTCHFFNSKLHTTVIRSTDLTIEPSIELPVHVGEDSEIYTIAELCGEEEE